MARRAWKHKGALPSVNVLPAACTIFSDSEDETEKINAEFDKNLSPLQKQLCARLPFELTTGQTPKRYGQLLSPSLQIRKRSLGFMLS